MYRSRAPARRVRHVLCHDHQVASEIGPNDGHQAARWLAEATRITVLTGAGISTDSGIPDFRGPNGLWTKDPDAEKASSLDQYLAEPELRRKSWQNRLTTPVWTAQPNHGHRALHHLAATGRLHALVTQNIDGLHQAAGHSPEQVIEVHGSIYRSACWECGDRRPMHDTLDRVRAGEADPPCAICGGILKSDTISFGQSLVPEVIASAMQAAEDCDLLLAVGTTLGVYPVANMVPRAKASGAKVIIVNGDATRMDRFADVVLLGSIAEVLPALVGFSLPQFPTN